MKNYNVTEINNGKENTFVMQAESEQALIAKLYDDGNFDWLADDMDISELLDCESIGELNNQIGISWFTYQVEEAWVIRRALSPPHYNC